MSKLVGAPLLIGAVAYTPNVVPIWEGIREYFDEPDTAMDFLLFSNYGRLVDALQAGMIDIAWNTNLAYARAVLQTDGHVRPLAMRDTDATFSTVFVAASGSGWSGPGDIATRRLALGSADSAHAAILPLHYLREAGVDVDHLHIQRFNSDIGKHGDTGRSELDAIDAVLAGDADVAAIGITVWENIGRGDLMPGMLEPVWQTETYSHCMFTALDTLPESVYAPWVAKLLAMDWEVPAHRRILELEGLTRWVEPHLEGYNGLFAAIKEQGVDARW
ncbi:MULTISPECIES: phosphate/phosphite/phosphonate ABC transporter substrate-binding protein [unclassified Cryobacterium]|uniref:Rv1680 family SBP-like protein n=1 Tax=unclassified Cryobacterium TaxID=2649013 RepID=UPI002AB5A8D4|nr:MULTISPECIES: PhnD/SsuA/transferrin family substrate-binding protein [Cryobacterium]MDY7526342.1 PhnD/SsuA/transferrin family substrate-binding protein [Cryobacterium sp. 10C2]MDY7557852.1 PhnD/SsuA/transferrin family substrate-binding protein [Cryobacterium sp. 10C3]MEB0203799.1 PhnD/SsuA/transferrin family substrate-binding protein [Cryobacterium sp. 5I3]MEB0288605.1 PhnD/SsuA/transferrin family substrate-binding protein [Cryobacterium sp. 10S3]MEB0292599.1 PhnD/SsuA/transferrin family su